eukprot:6198658-Pleurochrysis_carterae.AAC.3
MACTNKARCTLVRGRISWTTKVGLLMRLPLASNGWRRSAARAACEAILLHSALLSLPALAQLPSASNVPIIAQPAELRRYAGAVDRSSLSCVASSQTGTTFGSEYLLDVPTHLIADALGNDAPARKLELGQPGASTAPQTAAAALRLQGGSCLMVPTRDAPRCSDE